MRWQCPSVRLFVRLSVAWNADGGGGLSRRLHLLVDLHLRCVCLRN